MCIFAPTQTILVTTAGATHLREQKETHHLIQMLRKESNSNALDDLAHVSSRFCLADPLTKASALADELVKAVNTGMCYLKLISILHSERVATT